MPAKRSMVMSEMASIPEAKFGALRKAGMTRRDWVHHVRFSLVDVGIDGDWTRVSFNRIFSRILFMFQVPIAFVLCRKRGSAWSFFCHSVEDWLLRDSFRDRCHALQLELERGEKNEDEWTVEVLGSGIRCAFFRITSMDPDIPTTRRTVQYTPISIPRAGNGRRPEEKIGALLRDVLQPFGPELSKIGIGDHIQALMQQNAKVGEEREQFEPNTKYPTWQRRKKEEFLPCPSSVQPRVDEEIARLARVVDNRYERVRKSPILTPNGRMPPNLMIFSKVFDRTEKRFDQTYHYDCRPLIGEGTQQWCDLKEALRRERFRTGSLEWEWEYAPGFLNEQSSGRDGAGLRWERKPRYPVKADDDAFWHWFLEADRAEAMLKLITSPLGNETRLFTEYVATGGTLLVHRDPFARGDLGWIGDYAGRPEVETLERRRLVCLHYVLQTMACEVMDDDSHDWRPMHKPSLLILPIRANGAPWMAAVTLREWPASVSNTDNALLLDSHWFERTYPLYHSLMRPFERRLRQDAEREVIERVGERVLLKWQAIVKDVETALVSRDERRAGELWLDLANDVNDELEAVWRCYPHQRMKVHVGEVDQGQRIHDRLPFWSAFDENPHFDRLQLGPFLQVKEAAKQIERMVSWAIGQSIADAAEQRTKHVQKMQQATDEALWRLGRTGPRRGRSN